MSNAFLARLKRTTLLASFAVLPGTSDAFSAGIPAAPRPVSVITPHIGAQAESDAWALDVLQLLDMLCLLIGCWSGNATGSVLDEAVEFTAHCYEFHGVPEGLSESDKEYWLGVVDDSEALIAVNPDGLGAEARERFLAALESMRKDLQP